MKDDDQARLISRLKSNPNAAHLLIQLIRDVDEDTTLIAEWRDIWPLIRVPMARYAPKPFVDRFETLISAINPIDDFIQTVNLQKGDHITFLLGAGASVPAPSNIPAVASLLPELWLRARKLGRDEIDKLASWCDNHRVNNIEELLTAAYLSNFAAKNSNVSGLINYFLFSNALASSDIDELNRLPRRTESRIDASSVAMFQETLQGLFGLLTGLMLPAEPNAGHRAIVEFVNSHPNSSIVTTNYDGCIDESLISASQPFRTLLNSSTSIDVGIDLIKIHGSINWAYCDSCHSAREFDLLRIKNDYINDSANFAVVGLCKNCGGQRRPLLIPPLGLKFVMFPTLIRLWDRAREAIEKSQVIFVVGFSFSEADSYLNKIIERAMSVNRNQKLVICDPNSEVSQKLRTQYTARLTSFDERRIIRVVGSSDLFVPEALARLRLTPQSESANSQRNLQRAKPKRHNKIQGN